MEFSADFFLLKPKQIERGNGTVLYEVANRGGKGMLSFFNRATYQPAERSRNPTTESDMGDGFLMDQGFTLLWVGWQFDVAPTADLLRVYAPIATDNGKPIVGIVRSEVIVSRMMYDSSLADRDHIPYPVANPDDPANTLTVRDTIEGPRRSIPRSEWKFARVVKGAAVPDRGYVFLTGGFQPGKIYEVVYRAQDPAVVGVGPTAVRDAISYLKYGSAAGTLSVPAGAIQRAVAYGNSQSGRFLRTYLYHGFNEDEQHRKVFDGVMAHVAGAGRGSFNFRFAQPSRDGHPFLNKFYPSDIFPFTDVAQTDPQTATTDGLLLRVKPEFTPKIFYTNSSYEYWGRAASLIHTTLDGKKDAPLPDTTRVYVFAGGQHGPAAFPARRSIGRHLNNPNDYRWSMRALLVAMNRWVKDGTAPPASRHARVEDRTLVQIDAMKFPSLPYTRKPTDAHKAYRVFYGLDFATKGIVDHRSAGSERVVSDSRSPGRCGRQRARRREDARDFGTARDLHGMELLQSRIGAGRPTFQHAGLVHPAAPHARGSGKQQRSPHVDRGALPDPRALSRPRIGGCARAGTAGLPARSGHRQGGRKSGGSLEAHLCGR